MTPSSLAARGHWCAWLGVLAAAGSMLPAAATAQDVVTVVVPSANARSGSVLSTFGYDPTGANGGTIYSAGFGSGGEIRRITNVDGEQSVTTLVAQTEWTTFLKGGDPTNGNGQPTANGFLLNPRAIGGKAAYSSIVVADGGTPVTVSSARRNDLTQRLYTYDLTSGSFSSLVTQAEFATAAGLANPVTGSTSMNVGRQYAYSGNGQALYIADSTTAATFGGIYRADLAAGTVTRLLADTDTATEVAVLTSGSIDTILLRGGDSSGNTGGIDAVTFNGSVTSPRTAYVSAARLADFLETTPADITTLSMAADAAGNVYFNNTDSNPERRGIFRLDSEGRLSKVISQAERKASLTTGTATNPNSNTLRLQPRTVEHANGFSVTQLLYVESSPLNLIAGAYAFKAGDFDRDDDVDAADLAAFRLAVAVRSGPAVTGSAFRFDLNGNDRVDWKDVQILGDFLGYAPDTALAGRTVPLLTIEADADLNGVVDYADFQVMQSAYGTTGKSFVQGDFDGDNQVGLGDFQAWVNSTGYRSAVVGSGVTATPVDPVAWNQFLAGLTPQPVTLSGSSGRRTQFEAGYRSIVIAASVTVSGSGTVVLDAANTHGGPTILSSGMLEIAHAGALGSGPLQVASGATATVAGELAVSVGGLSIAPGGRLDVGRGSVTVAAGTSPSSLLADLLAGRGDGTWTGSGITSAAVAADVAAGRPRAIGWIEQADGGITFGYAAPGDTNLDGLVDISDVARFIASGLFDTGLPATWEGGDSNYDGLVDILDAGDFLLTGLYDAGRYPSGSGLAASGVVAVPEPAAGWLLAAAAIAAARRSFRSRSTSSTAAA
jgi:autotransporter-associated beta strand protein